MFIHKRGYVLNLILDLLQFDKKYCNNIVSICIYVSETLKNHV